MGNIFCRLEPARRRRRRRSSSAPTSTRFRRRRRSSRWSARTGSCATPAARSSAPTTSPRSRRCSRRPRALVDEGRPHAGVELLFTPKEEVGLRRRRRLRPDAARGRARLRLRPGGADRRDHPRRAVPQKLDARFHGRAAHAGMYPEEGRSAIAAAARAIADMRLGRIDEETSANVGVITGGTARNIVPEWCSFAAEARSTTSAKLADPRPGDARRDRLRRRARRLQGRDGGRGHLPAATASRRTTCRCSSRATALRRAGHEPDAASSRAAAPTRTSSTSAACSASTSRTG